MQEISVYKEDVRITRKLTDKEKFLNCACGGRKKGSRICKFSRKSATRFSFLLRNWRFRSAQGLLFATLTYPADYPTVGENVKYDLKKFCQRFKYTYKMAAFFWVLEFQSRGAPHFHLLIDLPGVDLSDFRQWLSRTWFECVGSNDEKHLVAGTECHPCRSDKATQIYFSGYATKLAQKEVPAEFIRVGRFWGRVGAIDCSPDFVLDDSPAVFSLSTQCGRKNTIPFVKLRRTLLRFCRARARATNGHAKNYSVQASRFGNTLRKCSAVAFGIIFALSNGIIA